MGTYDGSAAPEWGAKTAEEEIVLATVIDANLTIPAGATAFMLTVAGVTTDLVLVGPTGPVVTTTNFIVGRSYEILVVGDTNFTLIGASANTIGINFVATGVGGGTTGTATAYRGVIVLASLATDGWNLFGPVSIAGSPTIRVFNPTGNTVIVNVVYFFSEVVMS